MHFDAQVHLNCTWFFHSFSFVRLFARLLTGISWFECRYLPLGCFKSFVRIFQKNKERKKNTYKTNVYFWFVTFQQAAHANQERVAFDCQHEWKSDVKWMQTDTMAHIIDYHWTNIDKTAAFIAIEHTDGRMRYWTIERERESAGKREREKQTVIDRIP